MPKSEKVMRVRNSRKSYFPIYLMIFILVLTITIIKISGKELNKFALEAVLAFSAALIIFTEIHRLSTFYEINESSLIHSHGIFSRVTRKVDLTAISDADSKQTAWQRMLNYGDVDARLFSADSTLPIKNINNPEEFTNFLEERMNEKRVSVSEISN
tara:strand:- start:1005 stop:1475 length:471 start_codon:yes stop_codon:yes gene_type:complete